MKKSAYICPVTEIVRISVESHLMAASGGGEVTVPVNPDEEYNGVFRSPRNPNLWSDDNEDNE